METCGLVVVVEVGEGVGSTVEVNAGSGVMVAVGLPGRTEMGKPAQETTKKRMKIILK